MLFSIKLCAVSNLEPRFQSRDVSLDYGYFFDLRRSIKTLHSKKTKKTKTNKQNPTVTKPRISVSAWLLHRHTLLATQRKVLQESNLTPAFYLLQISLPWDFPGGPVVKTLSFQCPQGVQVSFPGLGAKIPHVLWPKNKNSKKKKERKLNIERAGNCSSWGNLSLVGNGS